MTVAIYETGVGGEDDATNIFKQPVATGTTSLGKDRLRALRVPLYRRPTYFTQGVEEELDRKATIEEKAWHKAGIFKSGCHAFSVPKKPIAEGVLRNRAREQGVLLTFVDCDLTLANIGLATYVQRRNATLAIALVRQLLQYIHQAMGPGFSLAMLKGLEKVSLPGRCQLVEDGLHEWYIDRAHTKEKLDGAGRWYAEI